MLANASLPLTFWPEAFVIATYLINRLPSPQTHNLSPFELVYHQKPDYSFLKVFGCECFPYLRPFKPQKLNFKSEHYIFLGYSPNHKGYKCLNSSGKVYISKNVVFNESVFPYASLTTPIPSHNCVSPTLTNAVPSIPLITSASPTPPQNAQNVSHSTFSNYDTCY